MYGTAVMQKINLIDVGASGGLQRPWCDHEDSLGLTLSFEPNVPPARTGSRIVLNTAVWNFDGRTKFYVSGPSGLGSSILEQNVDWVDQNFESIKDQGDSRLNASWKDRATITAESEIEVRTIDSILQELRASGDCGERFHFLKSDTQSGEFYVLDGAQSYLANDCLGLEVELFRYPLYKGMVLEDEVIMFLASLGFEIRGWTGYQNSFDSQADYLFLKTHELDHGEKRIVEEIERLYAPLGTDRLIKQPTRSMAWKRKVRALSNLFASRH